MTKNAVGSVPVLGKKGKPRTRAYEETLLDRNRSFGGVLVVLVLVFEGEERVPEL